MGTKRDLDRLSFVAVLLACCGLIPVPASAGLIFGSSARTQFESFVTSAGDAYIDFNSLAGTGLSTQLSGLGVTFESNIGTVGEAPFGPYYVFVSSAYPGRVGSIVGSPCNGCTDDGRVGYQVLFNTAQRRAGLQRNWNSLTVTRFYSAAGELLDEHVGTGFVGFVADGVNPSTDWVARIQIDGLVDPSDGVTRQVGYSDDLFFGSGVPPAINYAPAVEPGFNLIGNSLDASLDVIALFGSSDNPVTGVSAKVDAVWSWNAATGKWRFHSPQLMQAESAAYALAHGFEALTSIPPGSGYWVNAYATFSLPQQSGAPYDYASSNFGSLSGGFNLLAIGIAKTVPQFANDLGVALEPLATVANSFNALWAWDRLSTKWYFYAPLFEQPGAAFSNSQYCTANGYYDFGGGTPPAPALSLEPGRGFWVEKFASGSPG